MGSDHYLVRARLRCSISARPSTNNPQSKFNTAVFNTESTKTRYEGYEELVTSRLEVLSDSPDIETCPRL
ncbi:hypothetical protein ABN196_18020, partial [Proteus terrae]|uniref:hypothetical protein n=1 Tax=Proteus terrae TaxID=1574161 RepID=UPI0032DBF1E1